MGINGGVGRGMVSPAGHCFDIATTEMVNVMKKSFWTTAGLAAAVAAFPRWVVAVCLRWEAADFPAWGPA